jgi:hypothetical protein
MHDEVGGGKYNDTDTNRYARREDSSFRFTLQMTLAEGSDELAAAPGRFKAVAGLDKLLTSTGIKYTS